MEGVLLYTGPTITSDRPTGLSGLMSRAEDRGKGKGKGVLVNTGSTLIQAANDGEGDGALVGQRQYCYRQHCAKRKGPVSK